MSRISLGGWVNGGFANLDLPRLLESRMLKLLATGDRELIEDSWRDDFWGWGPNRDGKNMLGVLWMQIRAELRAGDAA